jgi:putative flippase GtrA
VINTALDFAVWNALLFIGPIKAQIVSTIISATSSYFMNRHWTFRHRARSSLRREYVLFFVFNLVGLVITAGILAVASYAFDIHHAAALNLVKAFGIVVATVFRYWAYRRWVFLHPDDKLYEPEEEPAGQH